MRIYPSLSRSCLWTTQRWSSQILECHSQKSSGSGNLQGWAIRQLVAFAVIRRWILMQHLTIARELKFIFMFQYMSGNHWNQVSRTWGLNCVMFTFGFLFFRLRFRRVRFLTSATKSSSRYRCATSTERWNFAASIEMKSWGWSSGGGRWRTAATPLRAASSGSNRRTSWKRKNHK